MSNKPKKDINWIELAIKLTLLALVFIWIWAKP